MFNAKKATIEQTLELMQGGETTKKALQTQSFLAFRSGGDSNPRYCLTQYVHLANGCFQPLSHRSMRYVGVIIQKGGGFVNSKMNFQ